MPNHDVLVIALGNPDRGDDGAPIVVAERLRSEASVVLAGRPGPGLLHLLPPHGRFILVDVTATGSVPGTIRSLPLDSLDPLSLPDSRISSHGFGPGETLVLARALGIESQQGWFVGVEGEAFGLGAGFSRAVEDALPAFEDAVREAIRSLRG